MFGRMLMLLFFSSKMIKYISWNRSCWTKKHLLRHIFGAFWHDSMPLYENLHLHIFKHNASRHSVTGLMHLKATTEKNKLFGPRMYEPQHQSINSFSVACRKIYFLCAWKEGELCVGFLNYSLEVILTRTRELSGFSLVAKDSKIV